MKYVDYFNHKKIQEGSHELYESRMLIVVIFSYFWVMSAFLIFYGFFSSTSPTEQQLILGLTTALTLGLISLLGLIKLTGAVKRCGDAIIVATCIATIFIVYFTGGPIASPFTVLAFVPAFLSFALRGLKLGGLWSAFICTSLLIGFIYALQGYSYPTFASPESINGSTAFSLMVVILIIINLVAIYEIMNVFLRKQVDDERDKYKNMASIALEGNIVNQTAESLSESG
ncbi:MAG: hypothetical protein KAG18_06495, partial [Sinobacterium sp.]|nr:hypothetical protein [Sinobacterium sp.]